MIFATEFSQIFQLFVNELPGFIKHYHHLYLFFFFFKYYLVPVYCFLIYAIFQFFLNTSELINNQVCTETGASLPVF